jgi:uncharacterized flavoprotein (TIGR03862 family)
MAAEVIAAAGVRVTVFDRMPSVGRKFLMAGRGGLNLTHSEAVEAMLARYGAAGPGLANAIATFPPAALADWCHGLGHETFVGSSGRVFPKALKASPLLRAWLGRLTALGVRFAPRHQWLGFGGEGLRFATPDGEVGVAADATVLALGGASWPRLGSDGTWPGLLPGVRVAPLVPSNCGFRVAWSAPFRRFAGEPLKRIAVTFAGRTVRGEAMVTEGGIEGGVIYALSGRIRDAIAAGGPATITLDLRPDLDLAVLGRLMAGDRGSQSLSNWLRKTARLPPVAIGLVQEALYGGADRTDFPSLLKAVPVRCEAPTGIARAISTAGGIAWDELDERFMLRRRPGVFAAGEMLDWEAPTGGYLLQACFSTGAAAGRGVLDWLGRGS